MKLHYRSYGEGIPLIVLHGLLGSSGNWHALAKRVFSSKFRVLTVDLRNHGRSPHDEDFSYDAMTGDLLEFVKSLEQRPVHLLGHSMGGKTVMHFALQHSELVDGLIVADIAPVDYPHLHENTLSALQQIPLHQLSSRRDIEKALAAHFPDASFRQFLMKAVTKKDAHFHWTFHLDAIVNGYPSLQEAVLGWQPHEGPTLFIRGGRSDYVQDEHLLQIRTLFPYAEIQTIEEAGHWIHADAPEKFGELVMAFLERL